MTTATMNSKELAEYMGVTSQTIYRWRQNGYGPAYYQPVPNGTIQYRVNDVKDWEDRLRNGQ